MQQLIAENETIEQIVESYSDMILRIAFQNLKNQADAEDVAQEVFLKLLKAPVLYDEVHRKAWIIRVTINQCKDLKKSFWHRKTEALTEEWQPFTSEEQGLLDELWRLPEHYRTVVYLYYYEGYTVPEIAKILEKNENTVSSWLGRARKKLKHILEEGGIGNET